MALLNGIDVSQYQGDIDWPAVKKAGIQFAFLRAGIADASGKIRKDTKFESNREKAAAAGMATGIYLYSRVETESAAKTAANELLSLCKGAPVEWPIVMDIEDTVYLSMSSEKNTAIAKAFLQEIERQNYYPMIYTYTYFATENLNMTDLAEFPVWIADYRGYVGYQGEYGIWQFSCTGTVDGINADVDLDTAYEDYGTLIREAGKNGFGQAGEKWQIAIFDFSEKARAQVVANAFLDLGFYSEVRPRGDKWQIAMYSFQEKSRAVEVSKAIQTLGLYNEVLLMT